MSTLRCFIRPARHRRQSVGEEVTWSLGILGGAAVERLFRFGDLAVTQGGLERLGKRRYLVRLNSMCPKSQDHRLQGGRPLETLRY
jgi:hypothetical protein